jgi:integrase
MQWCAAWSTWGLRECEVTNLELDDIDWQAGTLRINKGKAHGMRRTWLKGASCKV